MGLLAYLILRLGVDQILASLTAIGWNYPVVLALYAGHQLARAAALALCVDHRRLSFRDVLSIRLSGEAIHSLTFTGPFLAEPSKAWLLKRIGVRTDEAFAGVIAEYLINAFLSAALVMVGLTWLQASFPLPSPVDVATRVTVVAMAAFLVSAAIAIVFRIYLLGMIVGAIGRTPFVGRHLRIDPGQMRAMEDRLLLVLRDRPARLVRVALCEAASHTLLVTEVWWVMRSLYPGIGVVQPLIVEAANKIAGVVFFFIPSQVGAAEGTYAVVFSALGLASAGGFALAILRRLRTFLVSAVGVVVLSQLGRGPMRNG